MFVRDPCGIVCVLFTYLAIFYADYVVTRWILLETLQNSIFAPLHVLLFNGIVFLLAVSHMKAVLSDPGSVPLPQNRLDFSNIHGGDRKDDFEREDWTVCVRCETYRPPRAHHCRICKKCVLKMDHHCPWINNCVGERNQKYFLQFLVYVGVLSLYSMALVIMSWLQPCEGCSTDAESQVRLLHSSLLFLESVLFGLFVVCIMVDQMHAILYDETAVEQVQQKGKPSKAFRPKMALLKEVCGRGPIVLWFLPCAGVSRKFDTPLLSHEV